MIQRKSFLQKKLNTGFLREKEGYPLSLDKSFKRDMKDYKIYGQSQQQNIPNEYQEVEYIESTGTQYIDTGYKCNANTNIEANLSIKENSETLQQFGVIANTSSGYIRWHFGCYQYNLCIFRTKATSGGNIKLPYDNSFHVYKLNNTNVQIDNNVAVVTDGLSNESPNFILFARNSALTVGQAPTIQSYAKSKLKYFRVKENNTIVKNMIPCYRKSDNVIGMYDTVNDKFYTNNGTGTFLKGNDCPTPESPIEVLSLGENSNNLLDLSAITKINSYIGIQYYQKLSGYYTISYKLKKGKTIPSGSYFGMIARHSTSTVYQAVPGWLVLNGKHQKNSITFKADNYNTNEYDSLIFAIYPASAVTSVLDAFEIQLEKGSQETEYKPYKYIDIVNQGKNLIDISTLFYTTSGIKNLVITETTFTFEKSISPYSSSVAINIYLPVGTYRMSGEWSSDLGTRAGFAIIDESTIVYNFAGNGVNHSFTIYTAKIYKIAFYDGYSNPVGTKTTFSNIQLERGNVATEYKKYRKQLNKTIDLTGHEPLRKIGEYADYIDYKNGRIVRKIACEKITTLGMSTLSTKNKIFLGDINNKPLLTTVAPNTSTGLALSNKFKSTNVKYSLLGDLEYSIVSYITSAGGYRVAFTLNSIIDSIDKAIEAIGDGFDVYYILETPTYEPIELPKIQLERMSNNITAYDEKLEASSLYAKYRSKKNNLLPFEYQQVEYIESAGTQYIDIGFKPTNNTQIKLDFEATNENLSLHFFGGRKSATEQAYYVTFSNANNRLYYGYKTQYSTSSTYTKFTGRNTIYADSTGLYYNNAKTINVNLATFESPVNLTLFVTNTNGTISSPPRGFKVYGFNVWENNKPMRNMIPCYRKIDKVVGMYDIINRKFYTNNGTGTFIKGGNID